MMFDEENVAPEVNSNVPKAAKGGKKGGRTIEQMYQKKSQLEHILLRPDTYIGSVEKQQHQMWVYDQEAQEIISKSISFVPGLYKIFDEIVVNAADNKQRDPKMNKIEVTINPDENSISVWNNGNGIPVVMHQEHQIYVPELIFGLLLTVCNYVDEHKKTTGGRNGYGAKLANIFSTEFVLETADSSRGLKFKQVFKNNMSEKSKPEIKKYTGTDFTCVTFKPDLARFKMDFMDDDTVALLCKRVYDIAGTNTAAGAKLGVYLNGTKVNINSFQQVSTVSVFVKSN
jgi:DNA topoisomerase-2